MAAAWCLLTSLPERSSDPPAVAPSKALASIPLMFALVRALTAHGPAQDNITSDTMPVTSGHALIDTRRAAAPSAQLLWGQ